jgi:hypothetical protein
MELLSLIAARVADHPEFLTSITGVWVFLKIFTVSL